MGEGKNMIILGVNHTLKVNIQMDKEMEKVNNIIIKII